MAVKSLTQAEINTLLARTVGTLTTDDLRNLQDAINKEVSPPDQTLAVTLA